VSQQYLTNITAKQSTNNPWAETYVADSTPNLFSFEQHSMKNGKANTNECQQTKNTAIFIP